VPCVFSKYFTIKVWSSLNPETVIYQESGLTPAYVDQLNGFANYVLTGVVPVSGTIYIGMQQVLGDGLHLGFDRNTASNSRMFYNVGAGWIQTAITSGSFMIRAVMGDSTLFVGVPESQPQISFTLYPNPASDIVNITSDFQSEFVRYEVAGVDGKIVKSNQYASEISTADLQTGLYIMRVFTRQGKSIQKKLIIAR
jgi:hypothetical protein